MLGSFLGSWWAKETESAVPQEIEAAAYKLALDDYATFETYHTDQPAGQPLMDIVQAKARLAAMYAKCDSPEEWRELVNAAHAVMHAPRQNSFEWLSAARAFVFAPKPDGLDTMVITHALQCVPRSMRKVIADAGQPIFAKLHAADYATFIHMLHKRVKEEDIPQFCKQLDKFALIRDQRSARLPFVIKNVEDYLVEADNLLTLSRGAPNTDEPLDNLDAVRLYSGMDPVLRAYARDATRVLTSIYQAEKLPLVLLHAFANTAEHATRWEEAARSLDTTLRIAPPYLRLHSAEDRAAQITQVFFTAAIAMGDHQEPPPPYSPSSASSIDSSVVDLPTKPSL